MTVRTEYMPVTKTARLCMLGEPATASDVWVVCHGYGQLAPAFIEEFDCIAAPQRVIVAPEALNRYYLDPTSVPARDRRVGATWMTREERECEIADYVTYLDRVVMHVKTHAPHARRVRALGFSQGTATIFRWAARGSTAVDDLILWAGEPPADVDMKQAVAKLRNTRIVLAYGNRDDMVARTDIPRHVAALQAYGLSAQSRTYDGGHRLDDALLRELAET